MSKQINRAVPLVLALATSAPAFAQVTPDIQDAINRSNQIGDALDEQERTVRQSTADDDGAIDGEAGVYVLTVNDIFYVGGSFGVGWSENPVRTVDDVGDSFYASTAATLGVQTTIAETFDAGLAATVSGTEYDKNFAPSSRTLTMSARAGLPIEGTPLYIGVSAYGGFNYDGDFEEGTGFYGASLALSGGVPLNQTTLLRGSVNAGRQEGDIEENNAWNANLSFDLLHLVSEDVTIGAGAAVSRVWFDDFYEDVTFVTRKDWQYGGDVTASWSPNSWLSATASVGYQKRDSSFFLSNYDGFEASLVLSARKKF